MQYEPKSRSRRPTILCLINSAAYCRSYFEALQPHLEQQGFDVAYALDSHLSDVLYADGNPLPDADYFTDFCRSRLPSLAGYANRPRAAGWGLLYSDFDRFLTLGYPPPLAPGGPLAYEYVPGLLEDFFESVFERIRPTAVLYEQVSNSFAIAANIAATKRSLPFCSIAPARLPGRIEVSLTGALDDHVTLHSYLKQARAGGVSDEAWQLARDYHAQVETAVPDYMQAGQAGAMLARMSLTERYATSEKLAHLARIWRYRRSHRDDVALAYQHGDPLLQSWAYFRRSVARRLRYARVRHHYRHDVREGRFLLYPLHFHPEASTSVLAPDFVNEMHVIEAIAFRLPTGLRLVVKEHPSAVALQSTSFYERLSRLPNVELVSANLNAKVLARASCGVVCVTSTLGFEAAVMNKPVIALGDVLYGYYPNVRMVRDLSALETALRWAVDHQPLPEQEILTATAAYAEFTAPGAFDFRTTAGNPEALCSMAHLIAVRLSKLVTSAVF